MTNRHKSSIIDEKLQRVTDPFGNLLVDTFHYLLLFAIGAAIVWSAAVEIIALFPKGGASIEDILLLFIYLELAAMVGIYFKTNHMPTRFLIYVAITVLTRLLVVDVQEHHDPDLGIVYICGSILLLALANLVVRYGSSRFPSAIPGLPGRAEEG